MNVDDPESDLSALGGGASSSSRARMLAQQRELQLKKRQSTLQSGGMVRSSIDSSGGDDLRSSTSSQFTPAIRQFSAPKAVNVKETFSGVEDRASPAADTYSSRGTNSKGGFSKSASRRIPDEDDEEPPRQPVDRDFEQSSRGGRGGPSRGAAPAVRRDDRDEEPEYREAPRSTRGAGPRGTASGAGGRWGEEEESYSRGAASKRGSGGRRDEDEEPDERTASRGGRGAGPRGGNTAGEWDDRGGGRGGERAVERGEYRRGANRAADDEYDRTDGRDNDYDYDDRYDGRNKRGGGEDYGRGASRDYGRGGGGGGRAGRGNQRRDDFEGDEDYDDRRGGGRGGADYDRSRRSNERGGGGDYSRDDRDYSREGRSPPRGGVSGKWQETGGAQSNISETGFSRGFGGELEPQAALRVFQPPDLSDMRRFLVHPIPKACGVIQCYIRRNKTGTNKLFPLYTLYLKDGDRFLMCSKKRPKNKTSNYLISKAEGDISKGGDNYLGKLRSNFVGTEFQVFDDGTNPNDVDPAERTADRTRVELGAVMYAPNVLGSRGPRKMQVVIPQVDDGNTMIKPKNPGGVPFQEGDMLQHIKDHSFKDLVHMINKPPRWNEQVQAYVLNFNGRVTMASVKNFQLVDPEEQNTVLLQFGRVGKDDFTMDMQWPFTPLQAFAVTLSSFDSKIACD